MLRRIATLALLTSLALAALMFGAATPAVAAPVNLHEDTIRQICATVVNHQNPGANPTLEGHGKSIEQECRDFNYAFDRNNPAFQDTIIAICRYTTTEFRDPIDYAPNTGDLQVADLGPANACGTLCFDWAFNSKCEQLTIDNSQPQTDSSRGVVVDALTGDGPGGGEDGGTGDGAIAKTQVISICNDWIAGVTSGRISTAASTGREILTGGRSGEQAGSFRDLCSAFIANPTPALSPELANALKTACTDGLAGRLLGAAPGYDITLTAASRNACLEFCSQNTILGTSACRMPVLGDLSSLNIPVRPAVLNVANVKKLGDGLAFWALLACLTGILVSAGLWAMGSKGQNPGTELAGKKGLIVCCAAAFMIGAVPTWINYLDETASQGGDGGFDQNGITQTTVPVVGK